MIPPTGEPKLPFGAVKHSINDTDWLVWIDETYGQLVISIAFRASIEDLLKTRPDGSKVILYDCVKRLDGFEGLRCHAYSIDLLFGRAFPFDDLREPILTTIMPLGLCTLEP